MIISGALLAFLLSIFGQSFPCQEIFFTPHKGNPAQELKADKDLLIARPLELIDGSYATKK
jgi:hypothetical protein